MDLNDINLTEAAEIGAELTLEHPVTGEPLDIVIHLAGKDSSEFRNKEKEIEAKRNMRLMRGKSKSLSLTDDEISELLASATLGWTGMVEGGKDVEFSKKEAKAIYLKHAWIREQVNLFVGDRANFFTNA